MRERVSRIYWSPKYYQQPDAVELLAAYTRTPAFAENLDPILRGMKATPSRLDRFADAIGFIVDNLNWRIWTEHGFSSHLLSDVLLRLYEESEPGSAAKKRCLDYFDVVLRDRLAYDLLPKIE